VKAPARELLPAGLLYAALLLALFTWTGITPAYDGRGHDGRFYAAMARDEIRNEPFIPIAPYCYRLLTPALVAHLPGPVVQRFRVFDLIVWMAALLAWHVLARRTGLSRWQSTFGGVILATCAWGPASSFYNPCYVDPLMYLFIFLGLNLMLSKRTAWLAVLLAVAMLQREQCAVVLVCALVHDMQSNGRSKRTALCYGAMLATCATIYVAVRWAVPPIEATTPPPWLVAGAVVRWLVTDPGYLLKSGLGTLYALGLPLLGFAILPDARRYVREHHWVRYYLILAALSLLGGSDKARLAFLAQPVLILALLHGLGPRMGTLRLLGPTLAVLLIHLYLQFPPSLMLVNGRLAAPLVDSMERGTHGANLYEAGQFPVPMATVALHVAFSVALCGLMLLAWRRDGGRSAATLPDSTPSATTPLRKPLQVNGQSG